MYATDFVFDDRQLSSYGLMIGKIGGDSISAATGGLSVKTIRVPQKDAFEIYGCIYEGSIVWNFDIFKNDRGDPKQNFISPAEDARIRRWLIRKDGYHWIHFLQRDFEDIFYKVSINLNPVYVSGMLAGYETTVTSSCEYGFSQEYTYDFSLDENTCYEIVNLSDEHGYVYPAFTITARSSGDLIFQNLSEQDANRYTQIYDMQANQKVTIDSENEIIDGCDQWNWRFPRMIQDAYGDKQNRFASNLPCDVTMKLRYPRKAVI